MWFKEYISIYKKRGFKALIQEKGWVVALILFLFFLIKGLLWLLIPYLIGKGLLS
jgi:hypothetical protein|tara:strand:+ start:1765 stop:1929 length:165 start_codon:yes stop_codon:yes gene_type:complete